MVKAASRSGSTSYIPTLDGWRALAILAVVACHSGGFLFTPEEQAAGPWLFRLIAPGFHGVDLFFGISGFLIATRLLDEEAVDGRIGFYKFYVRRFFRILPPYLLYLGFLAALAAGGGFALESRQLWDCVFFLQNYLIADDRVNWFIGHFWSLAVEEHYYLIFPAALALLGRSNRRRAVALLAWALAVAGWRIIEFRHQYLRALLPHLGFFNRTDVRLDGLLFGAAAAVAMKVPAWRKRAEAVFRHGWTGGVAAALFLACVAFEPRLHMLWLSLLIPVLLLSTILRPASLAGRLLETGPLRFLGRLSYSMYLWNNFCLVPLGLRAPYFFEKLRHPLVNFALLLGFSLLSYHAVERPLIRLGHRLSGERKKT